MADLIPLNKRRVNVVNAGGKSFTLESTATNRGELEAEINKMSMGVSFAQKKLIIGENKNSLDVPGALLPASNFTLFIMPVKTKAGGEARNKVKELMKQYPVEAKAHFSAEKSYTVSKDAELEALLKTWKEPKQAAEVTAPKTKEKKLKGDKKKEDTGVGNVVDTVVEHAKKKYEAGDHTMTAEQFKAAKEQVKEEQATEYDITSTLRMIHAVVVDNARKLDALLEFANNQISYSAKAAMIAPTIVSEHSVYAEPVQELEESEIKNVQRQIEREFTEVKSY